MDNPAGLAYAQFEALEELERQQRIVTARDQYENTVQESLIAELENSLLAGDAQGIPGLFNFYATVIDEILNRLAVVDLANDQDENAPTVEWAMDWWQRHEMDEKQDDLIERVLVDGEAFIILQPEFNDDGKIDIVPYIHKRFTSAEAGGDNEGCKMHYKDRKPIMVSKRWIEMEQQAAGFGRRITKQTAVQYMTIYTPERIDPETGTKEPGMIQRFHKTGRQWVEDLDKQELWPHILPVIHVQAPGRRSRGHNASGPQMILDNFVTNLAVGTSITTLPVMVVIGGYPTQDGQPPATDGSNLWKLKPGAVVGFPLKTPETASIDYIRPGDLSQHIEATAQAITWMAITTGTPSLMSQNIRADAAAELIRRIEQKPIAYARKSQITIGNAITRMFKAVVELMNELGTVEKLPPEELVYAKWQTADTAVAAVASTEEEPAVTDEEVSTIDKPEETN